MGNRARSTRWKRFQKTAEMTFWGDKPNGSSLPPEGRKGRSRRRRFTEPGLSHSSKAREGTKGGEVENPSFVSPTHESSTLQHI